MSRLSEAVWSDVLNYLRLHHADRAPVGWSRFDAGTLDRGELCVTLPEGGLPAEALDACRGALQEAAQSVTGHLITVRLMPREAPLIAADGPDASAWPGIATPRLNPDYRFDLFITGPENRLAHAACRAVGEAPGRTYNPLFIHGDTGLGKTHLMQAICHQVLEAQPGLRIVFLTCESFVNDYIEAVERRTLHEFRQRYRDLDLLLLDDIQFLGRGERTQDEFFHTFNALYQSQRQIVLSADCPPDEIPDLAERLVSRFRCGLVARLDPLCVETRIAILRTKARVKGLDVPEDVLTFIGNQVKGNARELEGALAQVRAAAVSSGHAITMALARQALCATVAVPVNGRVTVPEIMELVADRFNVRSPEMRGRRRHKSVALARQACMYLARRMTNLSLDEIGLVLGRRDHSTVLHAQRVIDQRRQTDRELDATLADIEQSLLGR